MREKQTHTDTGYNTLVVRCEGLERRFDRDFLLSECHKIFGPSAGSDTEKTTRKQPKRSRENSQCVCGI